MNTNNLLNPTRLWLLLRKEIVFGRRTSLIVASVLLAVLYIFLVYQTTENNNDYFRFHQQWFPLILLGGGFIFTSLSFSELTTPQGKQFYLSLPASTLEKFMSKWLLTAILYPIAVVILYWVFANLVHLTLTSLLDDFKVATWEVFSDRNWYFIRLYFILQTLFLVGAIMYQKYALIRTLLTLLILGLTLLLFTYLCFRLVFSDYFDGFQIMESRGAPNFSPGFEDTMQYTVLPGIKKLFWWVLAPLMLVIGYFKLAEKEV